MGSDQHPVDPLRAPHPRGARRRCPSVRCGAEARRLLVIGALVGAVALGACGGDDAASGPPADCTRIEGGAVTLVAENLQWDTDCMQVAQGTEITFTVDNRDQGVQHNLHLSGPSGQAKTDLEAGPVTQTLVYDASAPGRHDFVCDIHSNMEGDLWVTPAPG